MIDCFLGDALGVLSCLFWSTVLECGARLPIHTLNYWTAVSGASFLTVGVFECDLAHCRSVAVLCMQYKIRCNSLHPFSHPVPVWLTRGAVIDIGTLMLLLAAEPRSIIGLLFPCQYLCGTILVTSYSKLWDWGVSRAGPMLFYWPYLLAHFSSPAGFPFVFFHSMGWYCGAGGFGLIGC